MTLYEIDEQIRLVIEDGVDMETGELSEESWGALDALRVERKDKLEAIGLYIKNITAEAEAIKAEADVLKERAARKAKRADQLKNYLLSVMAAYGEKKFETSRVVYTLRNNQKVRIIDESSLPAEFLRVKTEVSPDKIAIKAAIKAGTMVDGAELVEEQSITIK